MTDAQPLETESDKKVTDDQMQVDQPPPVKKQKSPTIPTTKNASLAASASETTSTESTNLSSAEELKKETVSYFNF